jgi:hypothetical protein
MPTQITDAEIIESSQGTNTPRATDLHLYKILVVVLAVTVLALTIAVNGALSLRVSAPRQALSASIPTIARRVIVGPTPSTIDRCRLGYPC